MSVNGMYIVQGEMTQVVTALRRTRRRAAGGGVTHPLDPAAHSALDEQDPLLRGFADLREVLQSVSDLSDIRPSAFLSPFLEVIQSSETTGPVTGMALMAISKFLSYGLIEGITAPSAVEQVAVAVTHARFVGGDTGSDEVVLMKILHVLRTLLLCQVGSKLTNPMVVEILQSCFRISLEPKLSELLRRAAEFTLADMIQLIFTRLPTFEEDLNDPYIRKMKMKATVGQSEVRRRKKHYRHRKPKPPPSPSAQGDRVETIPEEQEPSQTQDDAPLPDAQTSEAATSREQAGQDADKAQSDPDEPASGPETETGRQRSHSTTVVNVHESLVAEEVTSDDEIIRSMSSENLEYPREVVDIAAVQPAEQGDGIEKETSPDSVSSEVTDDGENLEITHRHMARPRRPADSSMGPLVPYGLPCIQELFRFLISLASPHNRDNSEAMIQMALSLITVALEAGADYLGRYTLLMPLVKNDLCRNLLSLLTTDRMNLFAATLRSCFILFEALRTHLKLQMETYLAKLMELSVSDHPKVSFEQKEMALEALVQLWSVPGLVTELYLNYDCDLYCSNLFEDLTKLLSKNSFPYLGIYSTHILSLDALLSVVETIERNCTARVAFLTERERATEENQGSPSRRQPKAPTPCGILAAREQANPTCEDILPQVRPNRMPLTEKLPTHEDLVLKKKQKKLLTMGTELFNQSPNKGMLYLQEHRWLKTPLEPLEAVVWIRENPRLDKKMIAEWIGHRKNTEVLKAFVKSFNFEQVRIDDALRAFLETFRLPGEAPVISTIMEYFAAHWSNQNGDPFFNPDAAYVLAYAIMMLNVDQHNPNVRKQNETMNMEKFRYNLRGQNGGEDFNEEFLSDIFDSISKEEIVMPEEHAGQVRDAYLWKVLVRRAGTKDGLFLHAPSGLYDHDLFSLIWGPTVAAIAFVFDKSNDETIITKCMNGFWKCADIAAHYGMSDVFDNQIISLCKFSQMMALATEQETERDLSEILGTNQKAQFASKAMFELVHKHGDILREGWKNILECLLQLYRGHLLPSGLTEVIDFVDAKGWVSIAMERTPKPKEDAGIFSGFSFSIFGTSDVRDQKGAGSEDQDYVKVTQLLILECKPEQIIKDSRYLTVEALTELLKAIAIVSNAYSQPDSHAYADLRQHYVLFLLEFMVNVTLENKDRVAPHWPGVRSHLYRLMTSRSPVVVERAVVNLIRVVSRLLSREEIANEMLKSLSMVLGLPIKVLKDLSPQLASGLHHLLKTNAADVHRAPDWKLIFLLLEVSGAAAFPNQAEVAHHPKERSAGTPEAEVHSDSDRGYTSDSELYTKSPTSETSVSSSHGGSAEWAHVNEQGELVPPAPGKMEEIDPLLLPFDPEALTLRKELHRHNVKAFLKSCETLAFLVRDAAHITTENFESCLDCLRTFTEASINGGRSLHATMPTLKSDGELQKIAKSAKKKKKGQEPAVHEAQRTEYEQRLQDSYVQSSLQLLDLVHTLHVKAADIYKKWKEAIPDLDTSASALWTRCWLPCLQCLAKACTDVRKGVRLQALTYLQRSLLIHDLQRLEPPQWEECFTMVLFPLLTHLRCDITVHSDDFMGIEEARFRSLALLCKVFLQHLNPLLSLPNFTALWITILDFNRQFYQPDKGDVLLESIPESLKNMLLVMHTARIFESCPNLYLLTVARLECFLPKLMSDIFPEGIPKPQNQASEPAHARMETIPEAPVGPTPPIETSPTHEPLTTHEPTTGAPGAGLAPVNTSTTESTSMTPEAGLPAAGPSGNERVASASIVQQQITESDDFLQEVVVVAPFPRESSVDGEEQAADDSQQ